VGLWLEGAFDEGGDGRIMIGRLSMMGRRRMRMRMRMR